MTKTEVRNVIIKCAQLYRDNLCNKELLFFYLAGSKIQYISVSYYPANYKHLTGIVISCSPKDFFELCCKQTISENAFTLKDNGTTELKLRVLERIMNVAYHAQFLGDYLNSNIYLELDKVVGSTLCGLGIENSDSDTYYPKSVLNGDMRKQVIEMKPIVAVYERLLWNSNYKLVRMKDSITDKQRQEILSIINSAVTNRQR